MNLVCLVGNGIKVEYMDDQPPDYSKFISLNSLGDTVAIGESMYDNSR